MKKINIKRILVLCLIGILLSNYLSFIPYIMTKAATSTVGTKTLTLTQSVSTSQYVSASGNYWTPKYVFKPYFYGDWLTAQCGSTSLGYVEGSGNTVEYAIQHNAFPSYGAWYYTSLAGYYYYCPYCSAHLTGNKSGYGYPMHGDGNRWVGDGDCYPDGTHMNAGPYIRTSCVGDINATSQIYLWYDLQNRDWVNCGKGSSLPRYETYGCCCNGDVLNNGYSLSGYATKALTINGLNVTGYKMTDAQGAAIKGVHFSTAGRNTGNGNWFYNKPLMYKTSTTWQDTATQWNCTVTGGATNMSRTSRSSEADSKIFSTNSNSYTANLVYNNSNDTLVLQNGTTISGATCTISNVSWTVPSGVTKSTSTTQSTPKPGTYKVSFRLNVSKTTGGQTYSTYQNYELSYNVVSSNNTVRFNQENGTQISSNYIGKTVPANANSYVSLVTSKKGYRFDGFYIGNTQYYNASGAKVNNLWTGNSQGSSYTLTAKYTKVEYTLSYHNNKPNNDTARTMTVTYEMPFSVPTSYITQYDGYTFDGWYDGTTKVVNANGTSNVGNWPYNSNKTLNTKYTPNNYTIYYATHNGRIKGDNTGVSTIDSVGTFNQDYTQTATYDSALTLSNLANSYPGYTFNGWYEWNNTVDVNNTPTTPLRFNPNGTFVDSVYNIANNLYVYPYYTPNNYTITYDIHNTNLKGDNTVVDTELIKTDTAIFDQPLTLSNDAQSYTGYDFSGWTDGNNIIFDTDGNYINSLWDQTNHLTVRPVYTAKNYTVTYDTHNTIIRDDNTTVDTPDIKTDTATYDTAMSLSNQAKSYTGYTFNGWYDGLTKIFNIDGTFVRDLWDIPNDIEVTPNYTPNVYTLYYYTDKANTQLAQREVTYDKYTEVIPYDYNDFSTEHYIETPYSYQTYYEFNNTGGTFSSGNYGYIPKGCEYVEGYHFIGWDWADTNNRAVTLRFSQPQLGINYLNTSFNTNVSKYSLWKWTNDRILNTVYEPNKYKLNYSDRILLRDGNGDLVDSESIILTNGEKFINTSSLDITYDSTDAFPGEIRQYEGYTLDGYYGVLSFPYGKPVDATRDYIIDGQTYNINLCDYYGHGSYDQRHVYENKVIDKLTNLNESMPEHIIPDSYTPGSDEKPDTELMTKLYSTDTTSAVNLTTMTKWIGKVYNADGSLVDGNWNILFNTNVYPRYTPNHYTLSINFNKEDNVTDDQRDMTYNQVYSLTDTEKIPTSYKGYTFNGWYDENLGQIFDKNGNNVNGNLWKYTQDVTAKATYTPNSYKVYYNTKESDAPSKILNVVFDSNYELPTIDVNAVPNKPGYTFDGWFDTETNEKIFNTDGTPVSNPYQFDHDITVMVKYHNNRYTIHYNDTDISDENLNKLQEVTYDTEYLPFNQSPYKIGYIFDGHKLEDTLIFMWDGYGNITHAVWDYILGEDGNSINAIKAYSPKTFNIDIGNDFNNDGIIDKIEETKQATYDSTYFDLSIPNYINGYTFEGYYLLENDTWVATYNYETNTLTKTSNTWIWDDNINWLNDNHSNRTLVRKWSPNTYIVDYNNTDVTDEALNKNMSIIYDTTYSNIDISPYKTGYIFTGHYFIDNSGNEQCIWNNIGEPTTELFNYSVNPTNNTHIETYKKYIPKTFNIEIGEDYNEDGILDNVDYTESATYDSEYFNINKPDDKIGLTLDGFYILGTDTCIAKYDEETGKLTKTSNTWIWDDSEDWNNNPNHNDTIQVEIRWTHNKIEVTINTETDTKVIPGIGNLSDYVFNVTTRTEYYDKAYDNINVLTKRGYTFDSYIVNPKHDYEEEKMFNIDGKSNLNTFLWTGTEDPLKVNVVSVFNKNTIRGTIEAYDFDPETKKLTKTPIKIEQLYDDPYEELPLIPEKEGYDFNGIIDGENNQVWDKNGKPVQEVWQYLDEDIEKFTIEWTPKWYILTYDTNKEQKITFNENVPNIDTMSKTGYTFSGYSFDYFGTETFIIDNEGNFTGNTWTYDVGPSGTKISLADLWNANMYNITVNNTYSMKPYTVKVLYEKAYNNVKIPNKKGYVYKSYIKDQDENYPDEKSIDIWNNEGKPTLDKYTYNHDISVTADYRPKKFYLHCDDEIIEVTYDDIIHDNAHIIEMIQTEDSNYIYKAYFKGWYNENKQIFNKNGEPVIGTWKYDLGEDGTHIYLTAKYDKVKTLKQKKPSSIPKTPIPAPSITITHKPNTISSIPQPNTTDPEPEIELGEIGEPDNLIIPEIEDPESVTIEKITVEMPNNYEPLIIENKIANIYKYGGIGLILLSLILLLLFLFNLCSFVYVYDIKKSKKKGYTIHSIDKILWIIPRPVKIHKYKDNDVLLTNLSEEEKKMTNYYIDLTNHKYKNISRYYAKLLDKDNDNVSIKISGLWRFLHKNTYIRVYCKDISNINNKQLYDEYINIERKDDNGNKGSFGFIHLHLGKSN